MTVNIVRLVCQCHTETYISPFATWGQGSSGLEHHLGRLTTYVQSGIVEKGRLSANPSVTDC